MTDNNNEIWVFLSHSNKDYEKVIKVRNLLEKNSFRPLMFFLKCLNDDDEIDDLIKREIDSRGRFILCDSENARNSDWVKREIEYIQSKQRVYQTVNIDDEEEYIAKTILDFKKESTMYISYTSIDKSIYHKLSDLLKKDWDFRINEWENERLYSMSIQGNIDKALSNGYIAFLLTENFLKSKRCLEELRYTFDNPHEYKNNIIIMISNITEAQIESIIPNYYWHHTIHFSIEGDNLKFDKLSLYFKFMGDKILERAQKGDSVAETWRAEYAERFYRVGERLYYRDVYTDSDAETYERAAFGHLKRAADLGHEGAVSYINNGVWSDKDKLLKEYGERKAW